MLIFCQFVLPKIVTLFCSAYGFHALPMNPHLPRETLPVFAIIFKIIFVACCQLAARW